MLQLSKLTEKQRFEIREYLKSNLRELSCEGFLK